MMPDTDTGTFGYKAPEVSRKAPYSGEKVDVYSFACVLYFIFEVSDVGEHRSPHDGQWQY